MKKIKTSRKKAAFTLAETLIAIGIIGVVSALTIPTLIKNYQKRVIETNLKKTFAELQSVIKQSELDNGPFEGWDYTLGYPAFAKTYITPYMKIRQCKSGECFAKEHHNGYYDVWRLANTGETTTGGVWCIMPKYITLDGRHIGIMPYTYTTIRKSVVFAVDVNGSAGRSVLGEDVFFMSMIYADGKKKIFAMSSGHFYGWNDTTLKAKCYARDSESSYCGDVIRRNGWKFPKDYPFFK
jgi:type II secretory pathway pseudopilin PulG